MPIIVILLDKEKSIMISVFLFFVLLFVWVFFSNESSALRFHSFAAMVTALHRFPHEAQLCTHVHVPSVPIKGVH